jgi:hypothetical protein
MNCSSEDLLKYRRTAQPFAVLNTQYRVPEPFHRIAANPT